MERKNRVQEQVKQQHIPVKIYRTAERLMIAAPMAVLEHCCANEPLAPLC